MFVTGLLCLLVLLIVTFAGLWLMEKGKTTRLRGSLESARQQIVRQQRMIQFKANPPKFPPPRPAPSSPHPAP